jgi:hypothetical protein
MAVKLLNTILLTLLFLLALLLVLRMVRTDEGFQNQDQKQNGEPYDLDLFFKNYPIARICEIYKKGFPTVVNSFSRDENGEIVPPSVANLNAQDYLNKTLLGGLVQCPFVLPKEKTLKPSYEFVMGLDDNLLVKAMSTLYFFATNLQLSVDASRNQMKGMEGFISECSADELENKLIVPLQCIPPESMKATEQAEINAVDQFQMSQRVSQKGQIAKKLGILHKNLATFQQQFFEISKREVEKYSSKYKESSEKYEVWANPSDIVKMTNSEEKIVQKKQESKAEMDDNKTKLDTNVIYFKFSKVPMMRLVQTYNKLEKEVEGVADELEKGIPGAPKN